MFVGLIDANERVMRYAVGAHFPMPIISSGSETRFLEGSGLPVGLLPIRSGKPIPNRSPRAFG